MIKKLFSHTAIYGLAPQVPKIAQFFVLPIITQDLTELDFGVAGLLTAYTAAISVLSFLGLRIILVNSYYKSPSQFKWAWRQIYGFLTFWNFFYAFILSLLIYLVIPEVAEVNRWWIILINVAPLVLFGPVATIGSTYFQLKQQPIQIATRTAIFGIVSVLLNLFFISYLKLGYMGWFWSTFISTVLSNASYYYPVNFQLNLTPIFNFKWRSIRRFLKVSLPTVPHYYSGYLLNSSDKMVMDLVGVSTNNVGKYSAAYTIGNMIQQLGNAAGLAVGPMMMKAYKKGKDLEARNLVFLLQIGFLVLTFLISIWSKEVFSFLIRNETLSQMYGLGIIIIMGYNYRPMYLGANNKLFYLEKTHVIWKVTFIAGLINVVSNIILIPFFGFEIAAYTTFVSLLFMGYAGYFIPSVKKLNYVNYHPIKWLVLTLLLTILAYYLVEVDEEIKLIVSIIALLMAMRLGFLFKKKFG
ncbi:Membrane protein involved in the export of O-antigen and teichoic acid [Algoriphagus faecimaris]|uniref:Membrane protein involved in the export of O-antigen and teichoic acid n=1 Tax=Algoriphagus faecimaris TaxID=686796 RepID=A0A1G6PYL1_9BACT|nr:oligosaccharide flippase family protein [Algoriphagus faecimaris]SDC84465.1 Membrane protein involved in the export of O-antigen and teichoic acid [Algoriphagus faecimaris]